MVQTKVRQKAVSMGRQMATARDRLLARRRELQMVQTKVRLRELKKGLTRELLTVQVMAQLMAQ